MDVKDWIFLSIAAFFIITAAILLIIEKHRTEFEKITSYLKRVKKYPIKIFVDQYNNGLYKIIQDRIEEITLICGRQPFIVGQIPMGQFTICSIHVGYSDNHPLYNIESSLDEDWGYMWKIKIEINSTLSSDEMYNILGREFLKILGLKKSEHSNSLLNLTTNYRKRVFPVADQQFLRKHYKQRRR